MANIRKTFNFREGVKVDDSVLVVAGQRVGIGSTIPSKVLDINGDVISSGHVEVSDFKVTGISTFGDVKIGTGITVQASSGIITANSYYGDGSTLDNLPTSQWVDTDVGLGFTSIYAQGNVGVGTTDPRFSFQVGSNPDTVGKFGVGINSLTGDVKASGIVTALKFVGDGSLLENLPAGQIGGTVESANIANYAHVAGIATLAQGLTGTPDIHVGYVTATSAKFVGVVTATVNFDGDLVGNASSSSETSALKQDLDYTMGGDKVFSAGIGSFTSVGIGTTDPQTDIQIVKSNGSEIVFGRDSTFTGNNGSLRFGKINGALPYSGETSLDVLNYGRGNLNFYLTAGNVGVETGSFYWHRGNISRLMSLTYEGRLGIGVTLPDNTFHVVGTSTVTSNSFFGNDVEIKNDLNVIGALTAGSFNIGEFTGNLIGNVYAATGVSTFNDLKVVGVSTLNGNVAIGTEVANDITLALNPLDENRVFVDVSGSIGIKTTEFLDNVTINGLFTSAVLSNIGIGSTNPMVSPVNFSDAGKTGVTTTNRFMLPPKITGSERSNIASVVDGALIYNTDTNRIEVWNGTAWQPASAGGLSGISAVVEDTTPELGGNLSLNNKNITGTGNINFTGSVTATDLTGTVNTAAQPNITSVGTLNSLDITNQLKVGTGITASAGVITAIDFVKLDGTPLAGGVGIQTVDGVVGYGITFLDFRGSAIGEITPPFSGISTINIVDTTGGSGYSNSDVDTHLNTSSAATGEILSWNGADYNWLQPSVFVQHDSANIGIATLIDFTTNLDVTPVHAGIVTVTASGGGGGISDGDKGDVVVSNSGSTWVLDTSGVVANTYTNATVTVDAKGRITSAQSGSGGGGTVSSGTFTAVAGAPSTIDTYAYDSAELVFEYTVFIKNSVDYQSQKLLVMRDGLTVHSTQYGIMYSNTLLAQLEATISGTNLLLRVTPETGVNGSTTYRIKREVT